MLDGACRVKDMVDLAIKYKMPAVAMTDHGNMFGAIDFYNTARAKGIKPIIGLEFYIIDGSIKNEKDKSGTRYHLVLLAKNLKGYKNLMKLSSLAFIDGFYYKPRIDKEILEKYSEGLIALSACIQGEIPRSLLNENREKAVESLNYYKRVFGEDFYIELQDHGIPEEIKVMPQMIKLARETNTEMVVTNDSHYLKREDAESHDILLCIQTGKNVADTDRMRFSSDQLYFKTEAEMRELFPDVPEAYENTVKIAEQVNIELDYNDFLFPEFEVPEGYDSQGDWLRFLCYEAAKTKYPEITPEIKERLDFELGIINTMGYDGYFLIVKDFIDAARAEDIPVGPGRGSAAGSIVAYLTGITQLDPLKYGLLFERFLDLKRQGMPDIDIDICAEKRPKVIDYVVRKYGRKSVTQIVTFGKLGAKSVIKDVARTMQVPAADANKITKLMPDDPGISLRDSLKQSPDFDDYMHSSETYKTILKHSLVLEGLVRHSGIHAAGVVIGPGDLSDYVPLAITKKKGDETILVQYEGKWLEDLKLLKMDFLGLKTLTIIDKTCKLIKESKNIVVDINNVDLKDKKTYELFSDGLTDGIFQFESPGMKANLKNLKPNVFEDLIAMVALYRPGPMKFIDTFINRKHGREKVEYDHPLTKNVLEETYGVTVYQEQVMLISKEMAGFSSQEAGVLRKAISKKKKDMLDKMYVNFKEGSLKNGVPEDTIKKIWSDWAEFANYAFNKSHAACYAYIAFQTAYLKSHYPVEFMAAILTLEKDPKKIPYFMEECKNMGIEVKPPNVNFSDKAFRVVDETILFGLHALKNIGDAAIKSIVGERDKNGKFDNIFSFAKRVDTSAVNKAVFESLIFAGAFDDFEGNRAQLYDAIENALDYSSGFQAEKNRGQIMLFDLFEENSEETYHPKLNDIPDWGRLKELEQEKEILGFYISGHPLHSHKNLIKLVSNIFTNEVGNNGKKIPQNLILVGMLEKKQIKMSRKNEQFAILTFEDMYGRFESSLFGENFQRFNHRLQIGKTYFMMGIRNDFRSEDNVIRMVPNKIIEINDLVNNLQGDITLHFEEEKLQKDDIDNFINVLKENKGKINIHFKVKTKKFKTLNLHSRKYTIYPTEEFLKSCDSLFSKVQFEMNQ